MTVQDSTIRGSSRIQRISPTCWVRRRCHSRRRRARTCRASSRNWIWNNNRLIRQRCPFMRWVALRRPSLTTTKPRNQVYWKSSSPLSIQANSPCSNNSSSHRNRTFTTLLRPTKLRWTFPKPPQWKSLICARTSRNLPRFCNNQPMNRCRIAQVTSSTLWWLDWIRWARADSKRAIRISWQGLQRRAKEEQVMPKPRVWAHIFFKRSRCLSNTSRNMLKR